MGEARLGLSSQSEAEKRLMISQLTEGSQIIYHDGTVFELKSKVNQRTGRAIATKTLPGGASQFFDLNTSKLLAEVSQIKEVRLA